jgi:hypothetical protein
MWKEKSWTPTNLLRYEKVVATHRPMQIADAISFHRVAAIFMPRLVALEDPQARRRVDSWPWRSSPTPRMRHRRLPV